LTVEVAMPDEIPADFLTSTEDWVDIAGFRACAVNKWSVLFQGMEQVYGQLDDPAYVQPF